jgi:hypothetical protein
VHPLKVSLEDLYNGTSKKLSLSRNILCAKCKGCVLLSYNLLVFLKCVCASMATFFFVVCVHVGGSVLSFTLNLVC